MSNVDHANEDEQRVALSKADQCAIFQISRDIGLIRKEYVIQYFFFLEIY